MTQDLQSFIICPNMMIIRDQKILLLRRADWAPLWPSRWHCPTGKIEVGELPKQAIMRETFEEVGLQVNPHLGTVVVVRARNFKNPDLIKKYISLFFVAKDFEGEPFNKEPRLHEAMDWFDLDHLPEPIIPVVKFGIEQYLKGEVYGEFGDEQRTSSRQIPLASPESFRKLSKDDITSIVSAFAEIGWSKSASIYQTYLEEQKNNQRSVWVAFKEGAIVGYVTLKWHSENAHFHEKNIPEISDLNVLPKFRKQGIASTLLDLAEDEARKKSASVGIGVGLSVEYGDAQKLYVRRGYVPDGQGITYNYQSVEWDGTVHLDDDLILWFTKKL